MGQIWFVCHNPQSLLLRFNLLPERFLKPKKQGPSFISLDTKPKRYKIVSDSDWSKAPKGTGYEK